VSSDVVRYPKYRWVVLGIAWLSAVVIFWSWYLIPSLAYYLLPELGLTHTQFTLISTGPLLTAIFTAIPGGALGDRYGIRVIVAIAIFWVGIVGIIRIFASNFNEMLILMCLLGVSYGLVVPNLPKLVSIWFQREQRGRASGIYITAFGSGLSLGLITGPLFGGWKPAFTYVGILTLVVAVLWTLFARSSPVGIKIRMPSMISGIKRGMRSKNIRLLSAIMFLNYSVLISVSSHLPTALTSVHNVDPKTGGAVASLYTFGIIAGSLFSSMLSDKVGLRKPFIYTCPIITATCLFFAWRLAPSTIASALILFGGYSQGSITTISFALPTELLEIGHEYVGGASGIAISLAQTGGFLVPTMVISPLVAAGTLKAYNNAFLVITILLAIVPLVAIPLRETGIKAKFRK